VGGKIRILDGIYAAKEQLDVKGEEIQKEKKRLPGPVPKKRDNLKPTKGKDYGQPTHL